MFTDHISCSDRSNGSSVRCDMSISFRLTAAAVFISCLAVFATFLNSSQLFSTPPSDTGQIALKNDSEPSTSNDSDPLILQRRMVGPCKLKSEGLLLLANVDTPVISTGTSLSPQTVQPPEENKDLYLEAVASLHLAQEMWSEGKIEKAKKIYQHALALAPTDSDIVNGYGEFLEKTQKDIVLAEHMYCRALLFSPRHNKALTNRKRTLPLVEEIDQEYFNRLETKMRKLIQIPENNPALRRMKKESYFRYIYHTNAIEGNTFTLSQTRSFVENRIVIAGKSIMEHNEILGMDEALHYVNETLLHRIGEITVDDILQIQKRVLGFVDPIESGSFRKTQVFVGNHVPPAPDELSALMEEFIQWLNTEDALSLHPIELAALAHYRLVYIHPFYDGNGRTSRLLMNLVLMQAGYPPVIIAKEEKQEYYRFLEVANEGDVRPFIRFISRCTERTLDEYIWATSESSTATLPQGIGLWLDIQQQQHHQRTIILDSASDINNNDVNNNGESAYVFHKFP